MSIFILLIGLAFIALAWLDETVQELIQQPTAGNSTMNAWLPTQSMNTACQASRGTQHSIYHSQCPEATSSIWDLHPFPRASNAFAPLWAHHGQRSGPSLENVFGM